MKNILLIEPGYPNKYPPLGLMKIAAYHSQQGHRVRFVKGIEPLFPVLDGVPDRVYVTTLFSFEWRRTAAAIDFAVQAAAGQKERVFVGGIAATLMRDAFLDVPEWHGIRFIAGLLDGPPGEALQLANSEFGRRTGTPIEELTPDYSILEQVEYTYPVCDNAYFWLCVARLRAQVRILRRAEARGRAARHAVAAQAGCWYCQQPWPQERPDSDGQQRHGGGEIQRHHCRNS